MTGIRFENVWKVYSSENAAVTDLNLEIPEGEFLVLVGPSGCGKTTSLRMLAGLERPSHGRIFIGDKDVTDVPPGRRDVSMVFQSYALYPNMNVRRNLAFGPKVRKEPKSEIDKRVQEVAAVLGIDGLLDRRPGALSGGQRQRVALGRAMIRNPRLFLMDEPLSNLDAALRVQMRAELIRLHKKLDMTTTVYVTHDQVEALTMGDRVAVLKDGKLLQVDTPTALYVNPESAFVGGFIGSPHMNLVDGFLEIVEGRPRVGMLGQSFPLTEPQAAALLSRTPGPVLVGIRPRDLRQSVRGEGRSGTMRMTGVVDVTENTGTEKYASVQVQDRSLMSTLLQYSSAASGQRIDVEFDVEDIYLFDKATEATLMNRTAVVAAHQPTHNPAEVVNMFRERFSS
jgi:multiple sugar transport system ATP-binding protein